MTGLTDEKAGANRNDTRRIGAGRIQVAVRTAERRRTANRPQPEPLRAVHRNNLWLEPEHWQLHTHRFSVPCGT